MGTTSSTVVQAPVLQRSLLEYRYPWSLTAAITRLFNHANIPNLIWGDHLTSLYKIPQGIINCGFIIPVGDLERAIAAIEQAGLPRCPCESFIHCASSDLETNVQAHFMVGEVYTVKVFLTTADTVLNLVPFTVEHANPLDITLQKIFVGLDDPGGRTIPVYDDPMGDCQPVTLLSLRDLLVMTLALYIFSPDERQGIVLPWSIILGYIAAYADNKKELSASLPDNGLRIVYDELFCHRSDSSSEDVMKRAKDQVSDKIKEAMAQQQ